MNKLIACFFLIICTIVSNAFSQGGGGAKDVDRHGALRVVSNKIVNKNGVAPQLRGISFSWSIWGGQKYYTPEVVDWLVEDFKVNLIRVSMAVEPDGGYLQQAEKQYDLITTVIDAAIDKGIYVLIDWHDHHADINVEEAKGFFDKIARKYAGKPNVIYEIWNEPEQVEWALVKDYALEILPVIRQHDPDNLIVVGSPKWDQDVDVASANPIEGFDNIAYSFHFYATEPGHQDGLRKKAEEAIANGLALFVTEWGVGEADGDGEFNREKTARWLTWMEEHKLSWVNWNITDKDETTALLKAGASEKGDWKMEQLTPAGQYIREVLRKLNQ